MVREFCSKEEVFRGGLRAVPDGGWGRRGNLFLFFFVYIDRPSADKQVDDEAG